MFGFLQTFSRKKKNIRASIIPLIIDSDMLDQFNQQKDLNIQTVEKGMIYRQ